MTNEQEKTELTADEKTRAEEDARYERAVFARNVQILEEEREKRWRRMFGDDYQEYVIEYVFD